MPNYKSNVADYDLIYVSETDKGLAVRIDAEENSPVSSRMFWLPKSQIEYEDKSYKPHQPIRVTIPDWLAEEHDLA
jgi:hypothetical protein